MKKYILIFILIPFILRAQEDGSELIDLKLHSEVFSINPGEQFLVALHFDIEDHWHTYWRNAGDAGLPVDVQWGLPEGFEVVDILWPVPERMVFDDMAEYAYEHEFYLFARIQSPENLNCSNFEIKADASWLICKDKCIPGSGSAKTTVDVGKKVGANTEWFKKIMPYFHEQLPKNQTDWEFTSIKTDSSVIITMTIPERFKKYKDKIETIEFFPYSMAIFKHGAAQNLVVNDDHLNLEVLLDEFRIEEPKVLDGVLISNYKLWYPSNNKALEVNIPINNLRKFKVK